VGRRALTLAVLLGASAGALALHDVFTAGSAALRGRAVPVLEQRQRFAVPGTPPARGRRIIVVTLGGLRVGFALRGAP
jgi:chemotaxis signal transduction protein